MDGKAWFKQLSADDKRRMADELETNVDWLYQIKCGKKPSAKLAARIHQYSRGKWSKHELRPDVFGGRGSRQ